MPEGASRLVETISGKRLVGGDFTYLRAAALLSR